MYEKQMNFKNYIEPTELIEKIGEIISEFNVSDRVFVQVKNDVFKFKRKVPMIQLFALYAVNKISTIANKTPKKYQHERHILS